MKGPIQKKRLIKESFVKGILELVQEEEYNALKLFNNKSLHWLTKLYSPRELRDFKELFVRTKNNIAITVERFPVRGLGLSLQSYISSESIS